MTCVLFRGHAVLGLSVLLCVACGSDSNGAKSTDGGSGNSAGQSSSGGDAGSGGATESGGSSAGGHANAGGAAGGGGTASFVNPAPGSKFFVGANFWNIDWEGQGDFFQSGVDFKTTT